MEGYRIPPGVEVVGGNQVELKMERRGEEVVLNWRLVVSVVLRWPRDDGVM